MQYQSERYGDLLRELNQNIWQNAEIKFQEYASASAMEKILSQAGFQVTAGAAGLPTAYTASYGSGCPVIGLLAEYDALDGLSQQAGHTEECPRPETTHGHGCGHNLLGTGVIGAALLLRDWLKEHPGSGTVVVYGCPAEEGGSGKVYMAREGLFDMLDIALTWHPSTQTAAMTGSLLANIQASFRFHGIAAHAGSSPEKGRSALDAVELMNVGVNYLREHMEMTDRVHYAVTDTGGISPNVVQARAEVLYLIRSKTNESAARLYERVCNIARGAALMTETELEICFQKAVSNVVPSDTLGKLLYEELTRIGVPEYTEEDKKFIFRFREVIGDDAADHDPGTLPPYDMEKRWKLCREHPMGDFIIPFEPRDLVMTASSDMGDVSQIVPLLQLQVACFCLGTPPHSRLEVAQGISDYAMKGTFYAADVLAASAVRLFGDPKLVKAAKDENTGRTGGRPYRCPIPDDVKPPVENAQL